MEWGCIKCGVEIPQDREFCDSCEDKNFKKIGGFLFLPLIGLVVTAASYLFAMTDAFKFTTDNYSHLNANAKIFFIVSLVIYIGEFLFTITVLSFFLRKKKLLPKLYILFLISIVTTMSFNTYLLYILIPGTEIGYNELVPVFRNVITALIWIPYFITSVRVKRTFIR
ncbi:DUF2569 domain-containing protein [Enterobacter sp. PI-10]|uniref:DUF2569 family protein n=1 Tax=Enterobacter sp. PI-10 TaxID=2899140 RepID=UPI0023006307|nr:DUF2569 family protein [Enterobacter sp. PI-10]MDA5603045.1 DUF2569 domain-containing protein [Enterobacter sp. PI-10]